MALRCALVCLIFLTNSPAATQAHDIYTGLYTKYGTACCDRTDCRPARYRVAATEVLMLIGQNWLSVPPDAIQYRLLEGDSGETGGGHWCGYWVNEPTETGYVTLCAILPPSLARAAARDWR
jgi:hypothetical protein